MEETLKYRDIEHNVNEMSQIAKNLKSVIEVVESIQKEIQHGNMWSGEAQEYVSTNFGLFTGIFPEFYQELQQCILYMARCSEGYQALDQSVIKEVNQNIGLEDGIIVKSSIFPS